jgi:hypothetical protein
LKQRQPGDLFEVLLDKWRRNENVRWADLFAAWIKTPLAPASTQTVRRVIDRLEWSG